MKTIEQLLKLLKDKKKKDLDQLIGETTSDFLLNKTFVADPNATISKPVQKVIDQNASEIRKGAEPSQGTNNILTPELRKKLDTAHATLQDAISSETILTPEALKLIESTFAEIQRLAEPSDKILTQDTLKLIDQNATEIQKGAEPPEGKNNIIANKDVVALIDKNAAEIQKLSNPPEGDNNILTQETLALIDKNSVEIQKLAEPPEGTNNILTQDTEAKINENWSQISLLQNPPEGYNNILTTETVDLIKQTYKIIQKLAEPPEGTNNILTDETLALIDVNYKILQKLAEPPEGTNNILTKETLALIEQNYAQVQKLAEPPEGTNNILTNETLALIEKTYAKIIQGAHPPEGTNNILVNQKPQSGFESINTQTRIKENWKEIENGREPDEGTNNILVDRKEQKGFESINTQTRIEENWKEIQKLAEPIEGTDNILVSGEVMFGFGSVDTLKTIDDNWSEIEKGREPEEGTNNILVDGKEQKGFESINTQSTINKNWSEIEKGKEPTQGTDNILVDGKEQRGFESINTQSTIDKNWSDIEKGKEPEEGTNNILVDGKEQKGFESINTQSTINKNWSEIEKGKEPTQGTDNILVDGKEQKGFESINTKSIIDKNWGEIEKGKEPTQGTDNILVDGKEQKGFESINTKSTIDKNWSEIEKGKEPFEGTNNILVDGKEQKGFEVIDTIKRINENFSQVEKGEEPTQGTDNILVDGKEQKGFETINTQTRINDNWSQIELGKEPIQGTDNILVAAKPQSGFEQIDTLGTIDKNYADIQKGAEPTQGTDNILVDGKQQSGFETINTQTRINKNWSDIELGKEPTQGTDNILVSAKSQAGFEQIDTLGRIDKNYVEIQKGAEPPQGQNNISNNDAVSLRTDLRQSGFKEVINYYEKIDEQLGSLADKGNYWNYTNVMPYDNSHLIFDAPNKYRFNKDQFRYRAFISTGKTVPGDFQESDFQVTYLSSHHGMYDTARDQGSIKDNIKGRVFGKDDGDRLLVNRPFSIGLFDRESLVIEKLKTMGYYLDYDRTINRVGNIETQYSVLSTFEKGKPTGFDEEGNSKYRNYFVADRADFGNEYGRIKYALNPLDVAKKTSFAAEQFDAQSLLYPHMDGDQLFYLPPTGVPLNQNVDDFRIYENTPLPTSDDVTYTTDPIWNVNRENRVRQILRAKKLIKQQIEQLNKFGENQHDFFEYSENYMDVPSMTWLSQDIRVEDFRYYQINKDMVGANSGNYNFGNVKKYEGTEGMRRQIDYYRNNPEISFGLENMRLLYLANPRNAQIFDPISMFWHPDEGKTGAVDSRKDLRLLGGAPKEYYGWHRPEGLIEGLANASGGKFGEKLAKASSFIETAFDVVTGGSEKYTKRMYASDGAVWAELGNYSQLGFSKANLLSRSLDIAAQFINPAAFTLLSEVDRYVSGFGDSILEGMGEVILKAKLGLNLGQIAGMEFRVMRGRNTLTSGQRLTGDGPITLNDAMEFVQNIAGNKVDNMDWLDGPSSYHEYLTDPRVWNADQRLMWNNLGGRLMNAPEKPSDDGGFSIDPIQIGKNVLKQVGINLDDPFAAGTDQQLMDAFKRIVTTDNIQNVIDLQKMKRDAVQKTSLDGEGGIYKNKETEQYLHDRTALSTRPDWFREKLEDSGQEDNLNQKVGILREYGFETNFRTVGYRNFSTWYEQFNDGNVQYVYDKNIGSEKTAGYDIAFDYHDYIGTVKKATPDIKKIIEQQKSEIQKNQAVTSEQQSEDGASFNVKATYGSDYSSDQRDEYATRVENYLSQFGSVTQTNQGEWEVTVRDKASLDSSMSSANQQLNSDPSVVGNSAVPTSRNQYSVTKSSGFANQNRQVQSSKDDAYFDEAEVEARGGKAPVSMERINELLNDIDPQIFRFWIRTISRTHYEVTPEVFYLDDENKVSLARPRYTGHSAVFFDSILKNINEAINPSWNAQSFFGRTEDVYTWQSTNRTLQFTTAFVVSSPSQLPSLRAKVQELIRMCYPQIQTIRSVGVLAFRAGPIIEFAIGDMWRSFGFITSMSVNWGGGAGEPIWELSKYGQIIRGVELSLDIQILHKELPHAGTEFYAQSFEPSVFYHEDSNAQLGAAVKTTSAYLQGNNRSLGEKGQGLLSDATRLANSLPFV